MTNDKLVGIAVAFLVGCALVALKNETTRQLAKFIGRNLKKIWLLIFLVIAYFVVPASYRHTAWVAAKYLLIGIAVLVAAFLVFGITRAVIQEIQRRRDK